MNLSKIATLFVALVTVITPLVVGSGCASTRPGEVKYSPLTGVLSSIEEVSLERARLTTLKTLHRLRFRPSETSVGDAFSVVIAGRMTAGHIKQEKDVLIRLNRVTPELTQINMHMAFTRDRRSLLTLLSEIQRDPPQPKRDAAASEQTTASASDATGSLVTQPSE